MDPLHDERPTPERPLLVGILVDVSGSMLSSMQNRSGNTRSRLETFRDSLEDLVDRAKDLSLEEDGEKVAPLVKLFAYGFGFGNPLSALFGDRGPVVRDLLDVRGEPTSTVPIDRLAAQWSRYKDNLARLARSMAGDTPMRQGFLAVQKRIQDELSSHQYTGTPTIFVLSDGDPTDASPEQVATIAGELKGAGVTIISCYVTDRDIAVPRHLYGRPGVDWPKGARLMFECASALGSGSSFENYMLEYDWEVEPTARLFTQINQSEILSEFLNVVLSPLREKADDTAPPMPTLPSTAQKATPRVFISYSHQDKRWIERLRVHLKPLERAGLVDVWDDTRIKAGTEWRAEIAVALASARVAVLLITADFLASDFIASNELPTLLEAAEKRGVVILPVIVGSSQFADMPPLARFQATNDPRSPLNTLRPAEREGIFVSIGKRIRDIVS